MFLPAELIKKKRNGQELSNSEISWLIESYTRGQLPDYQMSALLMSIFFRGMNPRETFELTRSMLHSGQLVDLSDLPTFKVDKHSTGGVGDKTSLLIGPIVAAVGLAVPMISGRGLGHTGGTLDKLESIPGFDTQLDLAQFKKMVHKIGLSFIGQTKEICPADKKIYALRDVTATVESLPLICASIMSKKLAEGVDGLVFDVKFGSGAFMKDLAECEKLAESLIEIAQAYGKKAMACLTNMNQPLGRFAGNALEVFECIEILQNKSFKSPTERDLYGETRDLSIHLSAEMMLLSGASSRWKNLEECKKIATDALVSGAAMKKFEELCQAHGGRLSELPQARHQRVYPATSAGWIEKMNTEQIGLACINLKAGRAVASDQISPESGIEFHVKVGDPVNIGDPIFTIYSDREEDLDSVRTRLMGALTISQAKTQSLDLIWKLLR